MISLVILYLIMSLINCLSGVRSDRINVYKDTFFSISIARLGSSIEPRFIYFFFDCSSGFSAICFNEFDVFRFVSRNSFLNIFTNTTIKILRFKINS